MEGNDFRNSDPLSSNTVPLCQPHRAEACWTRGLALLVHQLPNPEPFLLSQDPQVLSNAGLLPSCFCHFYLLSHKALESSDLGMSSCLHKYRDWGERQGPVPTFLQS